VQLEQLAAVFQHAVVVETDGDEDQVAPAFLLAFVEGFQHVVEQAEFRRPQATIDGESAFGEYRLGDPGFGGHLHVAGEHGAVQGVAGIAPHEISAHGADQLLQRPDARHSPTAKESVVRSAARKATST